MSHILLNHENHDHPKSGIYLSDSTLPNITSVELQKVRHSRCKMQKGEENTTYTVLVEVKFESSYYSISKKNQKAQLHKQKTTTLFSTSLKPDMLNYSIGQLHKPGETKMNKTIS